MMTAADISASARAGRRRVSANDPQAKATNARKAGVVRPDVPTSGAMSQPRIPPRCPQKLNGLKPYPAGSV